MQFLISLTSFCYFGEPKNHKSSKTNRNQVGLNRGLQHAHT